MIKYHLFLSVVVSLVMFTCRQDTNSDDLIIKKPDTETQVSPVKSDKPDPLRFVISDMQAGPFKVNAELPGPMTMMKYQMRIEQKTRVTEEGPETESVTIISESGQDLLWLKPGFISTSADYDNTIREINVFSKKYKTKENIGVGSTLTDYFKAYPEHRMWYTYVSDMWVVETPVVQAQFILDENDFTGILPETTSEQMEISPLDFKSTAKIKSIRLISYQP